MNTDKEKKSFFIITYREPKENKVVSLKAHTIKDSNLGLSFISISDFIFHLDSAVINPVEEALKKRYEDTKSLHLSIYSIISIEEVGVNNQGLHFQKDKSNLVILPSDKTQ